jgi:hypothetical protein
MPSEASVPAAGVASAGSVNVGGADVGKADVGKADVGKVDVGRGALLRAMMQAFALLAVVGSGLGALLFGGGNLLAASDLPYFVVGLGAAAFAAMFTVWVHGRFAATPSPAIAPNGNPANAGHLITARLQSLLAAAFGVKLIVLVLAVLALKQFPLGEETAKFSELTTFAVTFAGAALLCQLATAFALARTLRRAQ